MNRATRFALTFATLTGFVGLAALPAQERKTEERKTEERKTEERKEKKEGPNPRLGADAIVERLMSFDKNKDGKLTKDELPERLQNLIEKGDLNKDGALDKDEIAKLAQTPGLLGDGGEGRREGAPVNLERVIDDLGVRGETRQKARSAVQAHQNALRDFAEKSQAELLDKMKSILGEEEFKEFKAAVERQRPVGGEGPRGGEPKRDRPEKK